MAKYLCKFNGYSELIEWKTRNANLQQKGIVAINAPHKNWEINIDAKWRFYKTLK